MTPPQQCHGESRTAPEGIKLAIADVKHRVERYGWQPGTAAWERAFGELAGLNWALSIAENAERASTASSEGSKAP